MTVLDLGAHYGFYALLASKRIGNTGEVFSFEPSPRERKALRLHLKLNRCKNVAVQEMALGDKIRTLIYTLSKNGQPAATVYSLRMFQ